MYRKVLTTEKRCVIIQLYRKSTTERSEQMVNENLLKAEIAKNGISMGQLAESLGMSRASMSMKIRNKRSFSLDEANAICKLLGICNCDEICRIFLN